jgi:hypothetical protein
MKQFWLLTMLLTLFISCSQELVPKGDLTLITTGLPAAKTVQVTVAGPNGLSNDITLTGFDSFTLEGLPPGTYSVVSETVAGFRDVGTLTTVVTNTGNSIVTLNFVQEVGVLNITVLGKVGVTPANVTVRGPLPATTEQRLSFDNNGSKTVNNLEIGDYKIVAEAIDTHTTPVAQTVKVKNAQITSATLTYVPLVNLNIVMSGINAFNNLGNFTLTGPNSFSESRVNANSTFNFKDLQLGIYTLTIVNPAIHDLIGSQSPRTLNLKVSAGTVTEEVKFNLILD